MTNDDIGAAIAAGEVKAAECSVASAARRNWILSAGSVYRNLTG
jgi:hypothetical protein